MDSEAEIIKRLLDENPLTDEELKEFERQLAIPNSPVVKACQELRRRFLTWPTIPDNVAKLNDLDDRQ